MEDCPFCQIARGEAPANEVLRTDDVVAFHDITPVAPTHLLVIPTEHVSSLNELEDRALAGKLLLAAADAARQTGVAETGYRVVINTGHNAGQSVDHVHAHVLGGRAFQWPPG